MTLSSDWPDATEVHAALAPADALLAERRALYRLAVEVCASAPCTRSDDQLDNPLFRFRVGEALAGRSTFDPTADDSLDDVITRLHAGPLRLDVATGAQAGDRLADALSVVHAQSGIPGPPPRPLTEADGERHHRALTLVQAGLAKAAEVIPRLAADLVPHTGLLVVLDRDTSRGLVSASSRLFPGLILIDEPACAYDVAEALVHEGAHQKFFDLAITHDFLAEDLSRDRIFRPSWSGASWPVEQVIAAFHAYACLAQFAEEVVRRGETGLLGENSLLLSARARETEIGRWLLGAEDALEGDARWLLRTFLRAEGNPPEIPGETAPAGRYVLDPLVRLARMAATGRVLAARPGSPPQLHWLAQDAAEIVRRLEKEPVSADALAPEQAVALAHLVRSALVHRLP
ncbi:aKG-HExxH-type peptide beta-hydroxylase [Amycolatopsis dongchuanensis]|uniref:HEXXH motif domain-containing protein n=1 Tax=Amycolatopsis dongchuanensis TaxID=1070866 RepID=A0ABP9QT56_9PSEU